MLIKCNEGRTYINIPNLDSCVMKISVAPRFNDGPTYTVRININGSIDDGYDIGDFLCIEDATYFMKDIIQDLVDHDVLLYDVNEMYEMYKEEKASIMTEYHDFRKKEIEYGYKKVKELLGGEDNG